MSPEGFDVSHLILIFLSSGKFLTITSTNCFIDIPVPEPIFKGRLILLTTECIIPLVEQSIPKDRLKGTLSVDYIPENIVDSEFGKKYLQQHPGAQKTEIMNAAAGFEAIKILASRFGNYKSVIGTKGFQDRIMQTEHYVYEYDKGWEIVK